MQLIINENEILLTIFENFDKVKDCQEKKELWKTQSIIDVTNYAREWDYEKFFQNALIFIMSLMSDEFIDPLMFESRDFLDLSKKDKKIGISILAAECN